MPEKTENSFAGGKPRRILAYYGNESAAGCVGDPPAHRVEFRDVGESVGISVPSGFVVSEAEEPYFQITHIATKTSVSIPLSWFVEACRVTGGLLNYTAGEKIEVPEKLPGEKRDFLYSLSHKTCKLDGFYAVPGGTTLCRNCLHRGSDSVCDVAEGVIIEYYADGMVYCVSKSFSETAEKEQKPEIEKSKPEIKETKPEILV